MEASLKRKVSNGLLYLILIVLAVFFILPIVFVAFTALKSNADLNAHSFHSFPRELMWGNFADAWERIKKYMGNSLLISVVKVPLGILVNALAAFALTRLRFKWSTGMFVFILIGMMVPMQATLVPLNMMLNAVGLNNTYPGIMFIYLGFGIPFGILVLRGFMLAIPRELDEAAVIDGCGELGKFFRIIVPIAMPAIATLFILDFLATWNEFLLAQIFITKESMQPVTAGLLTFQGQHSTDYTLLNAGVLLSIIPVMFVYVFFQKYLISGMVGAVKG
jgi:raffinose/stachyose/melibiose transport system permease protein